MASLWIRWSRSLPVSSWDSWSCPMLIRTWTLMARCLAFSGPSYDGGVSSVESPVGSSGSWIERMWPYRRDWQKEVVKKILIPKYVSVQSV